ncbi:MAG: hypothetical protein WBV39_08045 [Rudaea sp.]
MPVQVVCTPRELPHQLRILAAERSVKINPANASGGGLLVRALGVRRDDLSETCEFLIRPAAAA